MVHNVSLYGDLGDLVKEPPLVVIEVYDDDALVIVSKISLMLCVYMFLHFFFFKKDCKANFK